MKEDERRKKIVKLKDKEEIGEERGRGEAGGGKHCLNLTAKYWPLQILQLTQKLEKFDSSFGDWGEGSPSNVHWSLARVVPLCSPGLS